MVQKAKYREETCGHAPVRIVGIYRIPPDNVIKGNDLKTPIDVIGIGKIYGPAAAEEPSRQVTQGIPDVVVVCVDHTTLPQGNSSIIIHTLCGFFRSIVIDQNTGKGPFRILHSPCGPSKNHDSGTNRTPDYISCYVCCLGSSKGDGRNGRPSSSLMADSNIYQPVS